MKLGPSFFVAYSQDGGLLATCGQRSAKVRRAGIAKPYLGVKLTHPSDGTFSPDGRALLLKTTSGALVHVSLVQDHPVTLWPASYGQGAGPRYSPCGRFVLDGSWSGLLNLLDATSGRCLRQVECPGTMIIGVHRSPSNPDWFVHHSPLALTSDQPPPPDYFTVWPQSLSGVPLSTLRPGLLFVRDCAVQWERGLLALVHGAPPSQLTVLDLRNGEPLVSVEIESGGTGSNLAWSPEGILAVVERHCVRLYSAELARLAEIPASYACDVAFSSQGSIAVGAWRSGSQLALERVLP